MSPVDFKQVNIVFAKDQPQYLELPAYRDFSENGQGQVVTCWRLSLKERLKILFGGKLWLNVLAFNQSLQPQRPQVENPFE